MSEHEHDWRKSDLMVSLNDPYDGIGYRWLGLQICAECGVLKTATKFAEPLPESETVAGGDKQ